MYGLFMTLALTFFLSTEMEELHTLRSKVESLERDVGGLEAIVLNLDSGKDQDTLKQQADLIKQLKCHKEEQFSLIKQLNYHIYLLYLDALGNRPFVPPNEPDEDEPVSTYV